MNRFSAPLSRRHFTAAFSPGILRWTRRGRDALATAGEMPALLCVSVLLALAVILCSCGKQEERGAGQIRVDISSNVQERQQKPRRLLELDEMRGGHTLGRHVGQSDEQLRQRLRREQISAASTYADQSMAEAAVGAALELNRERINRWMARESRHPNLVLDYDSDAPLGRTLHRGENQAEPCSHATVVLKWDGPGEYHVLTSYPECR